MNEPWKVDDIHKVFQFMNDTQAQKRSFIDSFNQQETKTIFLDNLKKMYEVDYIAFMDTLCDIYADDSVEEESLNQFYQWVVDHSEFETKTDVENEVKYYSFLKVTIKDINKYQQSFQIDEAINLCNEDYFEEHKYNLLSYGLAKYYLLEKTNKADFLLRQNKQGLTMYNLVKNVFDGKNQELYDLLCQFQSLQQQEQLRIIQRKVEKLIQKANRKLNIILKNDALTYQQLHNDLISLKEDTMQKIHQLMTLEDEYQYPCITQFLERWNHEIQNIDNMPIEIETKEEIKEDNENNVNQDDLKCIEEFYNHHHLYYKKTQIKEELSHYPELINFYYFYMQIWDNSDDEEKVKKLEELVSDIHESGLKSKESLRRLSAEAKKEIDDLINQEEEYIEEIDIPEYESSEVDAQDLIQIGKFSVIKDSVQNQPVNLQKIIDLLAPDSREYVSFLENLIYQIGYDKVHAYLLKYPNLSIDDLNAVIKLDRSLRFEYQRILEDIEMYFRSSLTYFITNKYDQKYQIPNAQQYFYKRGYLMRNIFTDAQEHYEHVHQLRDRIDAEMKNNNLQVINEFKRYKYALPFSTAAGVMTFGWIIMLFENLNNRDKTEYLNKYFYRLSPQTFCNWMNSIANLRNKCAHYHSFYRLSSLKELRPIMTKDEDANGFDDDFKHSSLFYYTLVMTRLSPNMNNIEDFIDGIGILFRKAERENSVFDLEKDYSFPRNWRNLLENEKCAKIHYVR